MKIALDEYDEEQRRAVVRALTLNELHSRPTLTIDEAGATLGLSRTSAYAAAKRGEIPTIRVGRRLIVPTQALLRLLNAEQPAQSA